MANTVAVPFRDLSKPLFNQFIPLDSEALQSLFPGGLARGAIVEVSGGRSSGRTSIGLHILAQATARGEVCAVVDLDDNFHPGSATAAGAELSRLIWVRCRGNAEHALRATDLLLHAGGFGVVLLDLSEANARVLNRIPLSYWYRFRRALEPTPTILLLLTWMPQAKSCTASSLDLIAKVFDWAGRAPFLRLQGMRVSAVVRRPVAARVDSLSIPTVA